MYALYNYKPEKLLLKTHSLELLKGYIKQHEIDEADVYIIFRKGNTFRIVQFSALEKS